MSNADTRKLEPKPPSLTHILAVVLELSIVAELAALHSVRGLVLCVLYAWFSATWAAVSGR